MDTTPTDAERELARRTLARRHVLDFTTYTMPDFRASWHHEEVGLALDWFVQAVANGDSPRLMVMAPARHSKSELSSRRLLSYALAKYPQVSYIDRETGERVWIPHEAVVSSYSLELASGMLSDVRDIMGEPATMRLFGAQVGAEATRELKARNANKKDPSDRAMFFRLANGASLRAASVGGSLTGFGASTFAIDDPHKDYAEALSAAGQRKAWTWFQSVAQKRLRPGAGIIITTTPWAPGDLRGRALGMRGTEWKVLRLPALAEIEEDCHRPAWLAEIYGPRHYREIGDPLWPSFRSREEWERIKLDTDPVMFAAMDQCRPTAGAGRVFARDSFQTWRGRWQDLGLDWIATFADTSFRKVEGKDTDRTVFATWGYRLRQGQEDADGRAVYDAFLLDVVADRMSYTEARTAARQVAAAWPNANAFVVEGRANGDALVDDLRAEVAHIETVEPRNVAGRKVLDARIAAAKAARGEVHIPEDAPWLSLWLNEHVSFSGSGNDHDDHVDTTSMAVLYERDVLTMGAGVDRDDVWAAAYGV